MYFRKSSKQTFTFTILGAFPSISLKWKERKKNEKMKESNKERKKTDTHNHL